VPPFAIPLPKRHGAEKPALFRPENSTAGHARPRSYTVKSMALRLATIFLMKSTHFTCSGCSA